MAWSVSGNIRGPQGPQGETGDEGPQGPQGPQGNQGPTGGTGAQGEPGVSLDIEGSVSTYGDLAGLPSPQDGQAWLVLADGKLYFYDGGFPANGAGVAFRGPEGPQGPQGVQGDDGEQGPAGSPGSTGSTGARGSQWFTGAGVPSGIGGSLPGDMYLNTTNGDVYQLS